METIRTLQDLLDYFGADNADQLERRVYKETDCGAWVIFKTYADGTLSSVTFGSTVEGSDAEFVCTPLRVPFRADDIDEALRWLEGEVAVAWSEANEGDENDND